MLTGTPFHMRVLPPIDRLGFKRRRYLWICSRRRLRPDVGIDLVHIKLIDNTTTMFGFGVLKKCYIYRSLYLTYRIIKYLKFNLRLLTELLALSPIISRSLRIITLSPSPIFRSLILQRALAGNPNSDPISTTRKRNRIPNIDMI